MKKTRIHGVWILFLLSVVTCLQVKAQYMPVVFDKVYGDKNQIQLVCPLPGDEVALVGKEGQKYNLTWVEREGDVVFSLPLTGFTAVNEIAELDNNRVLVVGQSTMPNVKGKKDRITLCGRIAVVERNGRIVTDIYAGDQGSNFLKGMLLRSGAFVVSGSEPKGADGRQGILLKLDPTGSVVYQYKNAGGGYCDQFAVMGNSIEYICAAFSAGKDKEQALVVRLDDKGKPYYMTAIPAKQFVVTGLNANINDGSVLVIGNSPTDGGIIYKIRPEGDIVFAKNMIPANQGAAMLDHLQVARNGNILVGGSGSQGYYALLRNDGTALYSGTSKGNVRGIGMNPATGESVVTTYDMGGRRGTFIRIHPTGKVEFERSLDGNFDKMKVTNSGEILLLSSSEGRVCMFSSTGEKEFDRYVTDNKPTAYRQAYTASSGELLFLGAGGRLVKLGHGLYVSDVNSHGYFYRDSDRVCHDERRRTNSGKRGICYPRENG